MYTKTLLKLFNILSLLLYSDVILQNSIPLISPLVIRFQAWMLIGLVLSIYLTLFDVRATWER